MALLPSQALAQATTIVITGSRIPQANLVTTSPVTQIGAQDVNTQGITKIDDLTNQLPNVFAGQNATISNGASGSATVNLRGLGAARTLVLIDGKRVVYGNPFTSAADLNQIPAQLVERIEVLTGGASAIYGSDAVSGVVNFIMNKDYEGLRLDGQFNLYQHHNDYDGAGYLREVIAARHTTNPTQFNLPKRDVTDGYGREISVIAGTHSADNRGQLEAYFTWRKEDEILQANRDYSACALAAQSTSPVTGVPPGATHWNCGGSSTSYPGRFTDFGGNTGTNSSLIASYDADGDGTGGTAADTLINAGITPFPNIDTTVDATLGDEFTGFTANNLYNYGPVNHYLRPSERYAFGAFGSYDIAPGIELYGQLMFSDYQTKGQIAPSGDFFSTATINCDNPLLSVQQEQLICEGYSFDNNGRLPGGVYGLYIGEDGVDNPPIGPGGGINSPGAELYFGDDPSTVPAGPCLGVGVAVVGRENCDDVYGADAVPLTDTDLGTPGRQANAKLYIGRRNIEGGGRQNDLEYTTYRTVVGFRGQAWEGWDYDISGQFSKVILANTYLNDFSITRLNRSLDVVNWGPDGVPGNADDAPICRSVLNGTDANCVPYNVFTLAGFAGGSDGAGGPPTVVIPGGPSDEVLAYLQVPLLQRAFNEQRVVTGALTGDLGPWGIKSPWAQDTFKAAFGFEVRRDSIHNVVDENFATGNASGQGGPTIGLDGAVDLWELFTEVKMPMVENAWLAKLVSVDAAYRYSSYDSQKQANTYKVGADWAPIDDVRFRASFQRAIRAANVIELFTAQGLGLFDMAFDPCDDLNDDGAVNSSIPATCIGPASHQVTLGQSASGALNSPAGQYQFLGGGNPNLDPESAYTYTVGAVFTPTFAPGLIATIDWWSIKVTKAVTGVLPNEILDACYTSGILCGAIKRNASTGQLWIATPTDGFVESLNTNIGGFTTKGVDISALYGIDLADFGAGNLGSLDFSLFGTWLDTLTTDFGVGTPNLECAGYYGPNDCGSPNPEWRHRFRVTWTSPWFFDVSATWRYYGEVEDQTLAASNLSKTWDAMNYFDLSGNLNLLKNVKLRLGVNNVLDTDPPIAVVGAGTNGNGNTYPQTYDALGRYVFGGITIDM